MARGRWRRRTGRARSPRKYGGQPSPSRLYKTENKALSKSGSSLCKTDFVVVSWKVGLAAVNELMTGQAVPSVLWPEVKSLIESNSTRVKRSLGEHRALAGKVGFYVELKKGVYQKPQLRVVCLTSGEWSHFRLCRKKRKVYTP